MNGIQAKILDIYKEIMRLCDENQIRFFAIGGTALGAERHSGFIPWDDDIDIAIPNNEYERFIKLCRQSLPEYLEVFDYRESKHSLIYWIKVHDSRTTFIEEKTAPWDDYHYGVFVDVMPMYGLPDNIKSYNSKLRLLRALNSAKRNAFSQLSLKQKLFKLCLAPINVFLPKKFWIRKIEKFQARWDFDDAKRVGYTWHSVVDKNLIFEREWFSDYVYLPFEDSLMRCCKGNKAMLQKQFGDYMKLPPEEKRISNHSLEIIDLDNSYHKYKKG